VHNRKKYWFDFMHSSFSLDFLLMYTGLRDKFRSFGVGGVSLEIAWL